MFLEELTPVFQQLAQYPVAFLGGFCSGIFRLNLSDEPVSSWLDRQVGSPSYPFSTPSNNNGGNSNAPQSIAIE